MKLTGLLIIVLILSSCATIPKTENAKKIEAIENTGVFEDKPTDTVEMQNVKKNAREVVQLGKSGIESETKRANQAKAKTEKIQKLADVGRYTIGGIIAIVVGVFGFVLFKIFKPKFI